MAAIIGCRRNAHLRLHAHQARRFVRRVSSPAVWRPAAAHEIVYSEKSRTCAKPIGGQRRGGGASAGVLPKPAKYSSWSACAIWHRGGHVARKLISVELGGAISPRGRRKRARWPALGIEAPDGGRRGSEEGFEVAERAICIADISLAALMARYINVAVRR